MAIAKVNGATRMYSDDDDVIKFGTKAGMEVISTWNLPLPLAKQISINYDADSATSSKADDKPEEKFKTPIRKFRLED